MTRAILTCFHKYTPFGDEFFEPMLSFFLKQLWQYRDEYDTLYLLDSTWKISPGTHFLPENVKVIKVDPQLRYYDAFKKVLPNIQEDLVLFMDNDFVVYREGKIKQAFDLLTPDDPSWDSDFQTFIPYDVVSIMDTIGTWKSDKLHLGNKFCPYFVASRKELLLEYLGVDWSPDSMPDFETLGKLTKAMVEDSLKVMEMEDDKSKATFTDGTVTTEKNLGYYHIRAGSTPAYLLATKHYGNRQTYDDYLKNQPKEELIRQCQWYAYLGGNPAEILTDLEATA